MAIFADQKRFRGHIREHHGEHFDPRAWGRLLLTEQDRFPRAANRKQRGRRACIPARHAFSRKPRRWHDPPWCTRSSASLMLGIEICALEVLLS